MNKKKVLINSLTGSTITLLGIGVVVLGAGFDSWEQSNMLNDLSKHENLKPKVSSLKDSVISNLETDSTLTEKQKTDANNFVILLDLIFNGGEIKNNETDITIIEGPMWIDWNPKLSKLMISSVNRSNFGNLKLNDAYNILLSTTVTSIKVAAESIKELQPFLRNLGLVSESDAGFIVGVTFLSITTIPLTILFVIAIQNKKVIKKSSNDSSGKI